MQGKTIGIVSIKGGVGKTSVASNIGCVLGKDFNKKVLVVDANFSAPNLGMSLGLLNPPVTLHQVLENKAKILEAIYETKYGFDIIPGAIIYNKVDILKLPEKLRELRKKYDMIIIDSSPSLNEEMLAAMIASDEILVVTTPDHVTLSSTLRAVKIANEKRTPITGIIINKAYKKDFEISLEEIEKSCGINVLAVLPHEIEVLESIAKRMPLTAYKNTKSAVEYKKLAACLLGENYKESKIKRFFRKFLEKIPKQEINRDLLKKSRKD